MENNDKHFELAVELARDALKALLIVNGGAATALIALMDKAGNSKDYTPAIIFFAAGAVGAVMCACFGYLSQLQYANHRLDGNAAAYKHHGRWQWATIVVAFVTLAFMISGIATATLIARP